MRARLLALGLAFIAFAAGLSAVQGANSFAAENTVPPAPASIANAPVISCAALANAPVANLRDAPTTIVSASIQPVVRDLPAYCKVMGFVTPQVQFELRLPLAGWNGKFLMQGCGGMCGILNMEACEDALIRGYAVVNTDMGHSGNAGTTSWAANEYRPKIDFGYRATHVVAIVAKLLVRQFYGRAHSYAYFRGCSTGGRQAMIEAQRFPEDFDGIVAGAPPLDESGDGLLHLVWSARASVDAGGRQLIDPDKLPKVHAAALAACGGSRDGFIAEPRKCLWDPAVMLCKSGPAADCLTAAEVTVVQKIYAGAHDANGKRLFPGGMARGSELEWVPLFVGKARTPMPGMSADATTETARAPVFMRDADNQPMWIGEKVSAMMRFVMMERDPGPSFDVATEDLEALRQSIKLVEPIYNARNPDLREFRDHGGKLILYHGWNDAEIPPGLSIDYYDTAMRTMGGPGATREFFRFFLIPGMAHCRRGPGGDAIDYLAAIEAWVEHGQAPDFLLSYRMRREQTYMGLPVVRYPLAAADVRWTRRVFAYPDTSVYSGRGDVNAAENWKAAPLR
jgi:feruloyl esterase